MGQRLITENARREEVRATMQLVVEELEYNRQELSHIKNLLDSDVLMSKLLAKHGLDLSQIPADTLRKYNKLFTNVSEFSYRTDALDVLKGSSLMQYISDKRMLQGILQIYFELGRKQKDVSDYYAVKTEVLMSAVMAHDSLNAWDDVDALKNQALFLMDHKLFANFVIMAPNYLDWEEFEELDHLLDKQIQMLQVKYE